MIRSGVIALLLLGAFGVVSLDVVVGTGDSMEPRFQTCDIVIIDTTRDTAQQLTVSDTIAYQVDSRMIVHDVVGVTFEGDYVLASGVNNEVRDRVTSEQIVGVVVGYLDTSRLCSMKDRFPG